MTRSLASARVEMNPHQVEAALFALGSPLSKSVLLTAKPRRYVLLGNGPVTQSLMLAALAQ